MSLGLGSAESRNEAIAAFGTRPDPYSGPYLLLMAAAVELARQDLSDPRYSASAKWFLLNSDLVDLFAECIGVEPEEFVNGR